MKIQVFYEFKTLDNLEELELSGNPVADLEEYHETAFKVYLFTYVGLKP
jgi:hypothetical protein